MKSKKISQEEVESIVNEAIENKSETVDIETTEVKEPVIGVFKPKRKFLNFVTGLKGRIRLLNNYAFVKGEQFSGMLEGVVFKITLCDEGTINFEEVDTKQTTREMIERFIDEIDDRDVTGYVQKFVVSGLEFYDDDAKVCYLEVEHKKPIDTLFSIFDEKKEMSESGMSILDALFSSDEEENEEIILSEKDSKIFAEYIDNPPVPNDELKEASKAYLEYQFQKMNEQLISDLKDRIEKNEKESSKLRHEISVAESKLQKNIESLQLLESRLESFDAKDELNGYVFFVSEEQKPKDIELSEDNRELADKIADIVGLKKDVLFKMLTQGFYKIKIAQKSNMQDEKIKISHDILDKMKSLVNGDNAKDAKIVMTENGEFEYRGSLTWHQIVSKMIYKGFEQDPEFDKLCGSNSYTSTEEEAKEETDTI